MAAGWCGRRHRFGRVPATSLSISLMWAEWRYTIVMFNFLNSRSLRQTDLSVARSWRHRPTIAQLVIRHRADVDDGDRSTIDAVSVLGL